MANKIIRFRYALLFPTPEMLKTLIVLWRMLLLGLENWLLEVRESWVIVSV
jgi:hypothetical protein